MLLPPLKGMLHMRDVDRVGKCVMTEQTGCLGPKCYSDMQAELPVSSCLSVLPAVALTLTGGSEAEATISTRDSEGCDP